MGAFNEKKKEIVGEREMRCPHKSLIPCLSVDTDLLYWPITTNFSLKVDFLLSTLAYAKTNCSWRPCCVRNITLQFLQEQKICVSTKRLPAMAQGCMMGCPASMLLYQKKAKGFLKIGTLTSNLSG